MRGIIIAIIVGLSVGMVGGWWLKPTVETESVESSTTKPTERFTIKDMGETASLTSLRARVKELEAALVALKAEASQVAMASNGAPLKVEEPSVPRPVHDPARWFEEMRKNDPERYAQITNRIERARSRQLENLERRLSTLSSIDTSGWSAAARTTHEKYQELLIKREELIERMRMDVNDGLTAEQRREGWEELHALGREITRISHAERAHLLRETAKSFGLSGKKSAELAEMTKAVIEATDEPWVSPRGARDRRAR